MIVPFTELPHDDRGWARPLLDVAVADMDDVLLPCLVDSGALNTLLPGWVAEVAGIDCRGAPTTSLAVGGQGTQATLVTTSLTAAGHSWEAEIGFCDPWPYGWGLLGQLAFFRRFTVTFRAIDVEFEVEPITR